MEDWVDSSIIQRIKLVQESGIPDVWNSLQQFSVNRENGKVDINTFENVRIRSNILMQFALLALGLTVCLGALICEARNKIYSLYKSFRLLCKLVIQNLNIRILTFVKSRTGNRTSARNTIVSF